MRKSILTSVAFFVLFALISPVVKAQIQEAPFSGNNASSYQCFKQDGTLISATVQFDSAQGEFYCIDEDGVRIKAVLKPPALQELEVLFVRVVYAIWAIVATFSFLLLVYLGYQYLISRGDVTKITEIRKRILNYIIGFMLVFLAVPILVTIFKLLGVNNQVKCYQGLTGGNNIGIGFQFFFTDLCTDPNGSQFASCDDLTRTSLSSSSIGSLTGLACPTNGDPQTCTTATKTYIFRCENNIWKLERISNE
ncbi:MAG: pilin [Candidatus Dojkabacteria bacterium]